MATTLGSIERTIRLVRQAGLRPTAIRISKEAADALKGQLNATVTATKGEPSEFLASLGDVITHLYNVPVYYADIAGIEVCVAATDAITYPAGG